MPSPPKERPSGRLGRLLAALRPSRAGPLPVQTGFPTSLADLVVKNHGRLKKQPSSPSSKRGKRGAAASPSPPPSVSPSPATSPPPASPPPPSPAAAVAVSPPDRPRPDLPPARRARGGKGGGFGLGLGFLAFSGVVSLALLVIWSKKVVAAVTLASFSLFLLESVRSSLRPRRPRPAATERLHFLDGRGRVSPIREVDAETEPSRPSCSDTDRGSEVSILAVEEDSGALDDSTSPKAKTKKRSWKKLIASAKKLHKGRKGKEADSLGSFRSDGDQADATVRGSNATAADPSDSRRGTTNQTGAAVAKEPDSLRGSRHSQGGIEIVAAPVALVAEEEEQEQGKAGNRFPAALVLVAVALAGLVAGKLPAVALTVLCYAFLSSVQGSPCGGGCPPGRRSEVPML
ncbi:hypothetical protein GQ55_9G140400 [Panicum hallii var. hallii]|uniref:Uncharacterized protein n=1 Tax=Panicum hallii var. hallii TaxID=1504633 RepID=A0A2T7C2X0_9POAL|nr:hypothetical protein GQ55_9G140400 [Panicum hallii var. hallii]